MDKLDSKVLETLVFLFSVKNYTLEFSACCVSNAAENQQTCAPSVGRGAADSLKHYRDAFYEWKITVKERERQISVMFLEKILIFLQNLS